MKSALLPILVTIALCLSSWASTNEPPIEANDAAQHVGETVVVTGTIAEVHQFKGGNIALDCDAKYPHQDFEVYIPKTLVGTTGDMHEYAGKETVVEVQTHSMIKARI